MATKLEEFTASTKSKIQGSILEDFQFEANKPLILTFSVPGLDGKLLLIIENKLTTQLSGSQVLIGSNLQVALKQAD